MATTPRPDRYICPLCERTEGVDQLPAVCEYCAQDMIPMVTWVRRYLRKNQDQKESDK